MDPENVRKGAGGKNKKKSKKKMKAKGKKNAQKSVQNESTSAEPGTSGTKSSTPDDESRNEGEKQKKVNTKETKENVDTKDTKETEDTKETKVQISQGDIAKEIKLSYKRMVMLSEIIEEQAGGLEDVEEMGAEVKKFFEHWMAAKAEQDRSNKTPESDSESSVEKESLTEQEPGEVQKSGSIVCISETARDDGSEEEVYQAASILMGMGTGRSEAADEATESGAESSTAEMEAEKMESQLQKAKAKHAENEEKIARIEEQLESLVGVIWKMHCKPTAEEENVAEIVPLEREMPAGQLGSPPKEEIVDEPEPKTLNADQFPEETETTKDAKFSQVEANLKEIFEENPESLSKESETNRSKEAEQVKCSAKRTIFEKKVTNLILRRVVTADFRRRRRRSEMTFILMKLGEEKKVVEKLLRETDYNPFRIARSLLHAVWHMIVQEPKSEGSWEEEAAKETERIIHDIEEGLIDDEHEVADKAKMIAKIRRFFETWRVSLTILESKLKFD